MIVKVLYSILKVNLIRKIGYQQLNYFVYEVVFIIVAFTV